MGYTQRGELTKSSLPDSDVPDYQAITHLEVLSAIEVGNRSVIKPDDLSFMEHDEEMVIPGHVPLKSY